MERVRRVVYFHYIHLIKSGSFIKENSRNRKDKTGCDRIKALLYENDGFVLLYKRLTASEGRYRWPRNKNEVQPITWRQFDWLMSGLEIEQPKAIRPRKPENEKE